MEYAIRLKGLTKSFQKEKVLKNITHDFEKAWSRMECHGGSE